MIDWSRLDLTEPLVVPVSSSAIFQVEYNPLSYSMTVYFHDGTEYEYDSVPLYIFIALVQSSSVGRYFNAVIRDNYSYTQLA